MATQTSFVDEVFRPVPYMGVIYVVAEAMKLGFVNGHPDWCNLGQGQPEVGELPGAPPRIQHVDIQPLDQAYGPIGGTDEARGVVAAHYNRLFRAGKPQFSPSNVSIAAGGRLVLSRVFATLGNVPVGYQLPDYTAYEDMLDYHQYRIQPVAVNTTAEDGFTITPQRLAEEIDQHQLKAFVLSNPCNPTGHAIAGEELQQLLDVARDKRCVLILDEFYSHFFYTEDGQPGPGAVTAAPYLGDIDDEPVVLIDGLTKSFRYPGWRFGWAVASTEIIERINRAASAIDGGPSNLVQRAAIAALQPDQADQETNALRQAFARKRNLMVDRLEEMGIRCARKPRGTFYVWASIADLPEPLCNADAFFRSALERKVMTVPGRFFDVNPGKRRPANPEYDAWVRFSFGPPEDNVRMGLDRLEEMIQAASG